MRSFTVSGDRTPELILREGQRQLFQRHDARQLLHRPKAILSVHTFVSLVLREPDEPNIIRFFVLREHETSILEFGVPNQGLSPGWGTVADASVASLRQRSAASCPPCLRASIQPSRSACRKRQSLRLPSPIGMAGKYPRVPNVYGTCIQATKVLCVSSQERYLPLEPSAAALMSTTPAFGICE